MQNDHACEDLFAMMLDVHGCTDDAKDQAAYRSEKREEVQEVGRWQNVDQHKERQADAQDRKQEAEQDKTPGWHMVGRLTVCTV